MEPQSLPRKIYNYFIKRWILAAIIVTTPTYYLLIVGTYGESWGFVDSMGDMTTLGGWIFWPMFVFVLLFAFLKSYMDKYNEEAKENGQFILQKMLSSVNFIKEKKMQRFVDFIDKHHNETGINPFTKITQPKHQIEDILANIQICLSEIFDIRREDIGLSIIYKFDKPNSDNWKYLHTMNISNDLPLSELVNNPMTSARQIIDGKTPSVFFADKREGEEKRNFVMGKKDKPNNGIGSIICRDISIGNNSKYIFAILSITTYSKQICEVNDIYSQYRIENILLPTFEERLRLELSLLYIKNVIAA